jgi:4-amino-4-deoxy-L-arabinose transferase-like glycosyltransferase
LAFAFAALCSFTANYVALPLTETLAIFFAALALLLAAKASRPNARPVAVLRLWLTCGLALGAGVLLRPDGGILLGAVLLSLLARLFRADADRRRVLSVIVLVTFVAVAPLIPWTLRNWKTFHVFQPLAPRYANAPDEYVPLGFNRWVKTWLVEYVSVEDVFWNVSTETQGEPVDVNVLPARAFDSPEERARTSELFAEFNRTLMLTAETDAKFDQLAQGRIAHSPLRYYVVLPAARVSDMWFRPRTEMLPVDQRWWTFDDPPESWFAIGYGTLNLLVAGLGFAGLIRFRQVSIYGILLSFVVIRSLFLSTMENPEPRYTLEMFPVMFVMAAAVCARARPNTEYKETKSH